MDAQRKANAEALATLREVCRRMSAHVGSGWEAELYEADIRSLLPRVEMAIFKAEGRKPWMDPRRPKWVLGMLKTWEAQEIAQAKAGRISHKTSRTKGADLCAIHCPGKLQTPAGLRYMRHKHFKKNTYAK